MNVAIVRHHIQLAISPDRRSFSGCANRIFPELIACFAVEGVNFSSIGDHVQDAVFHQKSGVARLDTVNSPNAVTFGDVAFASAVDAFDAAEVGVVNVIFAVRDVDKMSIDSRSRIEAAT